MLQEFKDFINKGNMVELAVAVVMATAFSPVITAIVDGVFMQIIAAIVGKPDFDAITIGLGDAEIYIGTVMTALVNFISIAAVLFLIIQAYNKFRRDSEAELPPTEIDLLTEIRDQLAKR